MIDINDYTLLVNGGQVTRSVEDSIHGDDGYGKMEEPTQNEIDDTIRQTKIIF